MNQTPKIIKVAAAITLFLIILSVGIYFSKFGGVGAVFGDKNSFGQFGDYIGGLLNPVLTFFTVALLIWSIQIQVTELSRSTKALEASQKAHEEQVLISREELESAQMSHANQIAQLKKEAIRKQLNDHAEILHESCQYLMCTPIFPDSMNVQLSLHDLIYKQGMKDNNRAINSRLRIHIIMTGNLDKSNPETLLIMSVRKELQLFFSTVIDLIPRLETPSLSNLWDSRIRSLIGDCMTLELITAEEAKKLGDKLTEITPVSLF